MPLAIDKLKQQLVEECFSVLRPLIERFKELEILERMMPTAIEVAAEFKDISLTRMETRQLSVAPPPSSKRGAKSGSTHAPRVNRDRIRASAIPFIERHPTGSTTDEMVAHLRAVRIIPPQMTKSSASGAVLDALKNSPEIRTVRTIGMGGTYTFYPKPLLKQQEPPKPRKTTPQNHARHTGMKHRIRDFVIETLKKSDHPMDWAELHDIAVNKAGFPARPSKSDTLHNQMARQMREMVADNQLIRKEIIGGRPLFSLPSEV